MNEVSAVYWYLSISTYLSIISIRSVLSVHAIQKYEHVGITLVFVEIPILIYAFLSKVSDPCQGCHVECLWTTLCTSVHINNFPSWLQKRLNDTACWFANSESGETTLKPPIFSSFLKIFDLAGFLGFHILRDGKSDSPERSVFW